MPEASQPIIFKQHWMYMRLNDATSSELNPPFTHLRLKAINLKSQGSFCQTIQITTGEMKTNIVQQRPLARLFQKLKVMLLVLSFLNIDLNQPIYCINPDQSENLLDIAELTNVSHEHVDRIEPFTPTYYHSKKEFKLKENYTLKIRNFAVRSRGFF